MSVTEWEKTIGLADQDGTVARVSVDPDEEDPIALLSVKSGAATVSCGPTATAMRQLAAALLDAADAMDDGGS